MWVVPDYLLQLPRRDKANSYCHQQKTYNRVLSIALEKRYIHPSDPVTPDDAFAALGSATAPSLVARTLALITPTGDKKLPPTLSRNATGSLLRTLTTHPAGAQAAWNWLRTNWDTISRDGANNRSIAGFRLAEGALGGLATAGHLEEVSGFFGRQEVHEEFVLPLRQAEDVIRARARFAEADWKRKGD
jgi:hypothetical protein